MTNYTSSHLCTKIYVSNWEMFSNSLAGLGKHLMSMLGSKRSLYEAMNELHGKTMKVHMEDLGKQEQACEHLKAEMTALYPDCCVTPYATRLLGMAHPNTAIYMFFDSDG